VKKKVSQKKNQQAGSPSKSQIKLSPEEAQALAKEYLPVFKPVLDEIMIGYLKPVMEEISKLKTGYNQLISLLESAGRQSQGVQPQSQIAAGGNPQVLQTGTQTGGLVPLLQAVAAAAPVLRQIFGGGGSETGLAKDEALITRVANIIEAANRISRSPWDDVMPRVFVRLLLKTGGLTKEEAKKLLKED